jgi:hypothetical protein
MLSYATSDVWHGTMIGTMNKAGRVIRGIISRFFIYFPLVFSYWSLSN